MENLEGRYTNYVCVAIRFSFQVIFRFCVLNKYDILLIRSAFFLSSYRSN